jgi:FOG: WD40 repeat
MTQSATTPTLAERQEWTQTIDAVVVACVWIGERLAIVDGEGHVAWFDPNQPNLVSRPTHDGAILAVTASADGKALITGGDDGAVMRHAPDSDGVPLLRIPGRWIEHLVLSSPLGLGVAAAGREAIVFDAVSGAVVRRFTPPSTIGGLAIDPKGRRVAATHYGGATLWWLGIDGGNPRRLEWQGSHLAVAWSPDGRFVVTAMQEAMLHGWRLDDGADMRMSGYETKTRALSWSVKGRWLATSGALQAVCWPFAGADGPMGKPPLQCGAHSHRDPEYPREATSRSDDGERRPLVTRVAFSPTEELLAVGYDDGCVALVRLADGSSLSATSPEEGSVTTLAWDRGGTRLASGTESGRIAVFRIGEKSPSAIHRTPGRRNRRR